jgi:uncharacterized membrane protein
MVVWFLARSGRLTPDYRHFRGEPQDLRSITGILTGVGQRQPLSVIQLGLLLLIATPIARVAFSVFAFAVQRDRLYMVITLAVLLVLLGSLSGFAGAPR